MWIVQPWLYNPNNFCHTLNLFFRDDMSQENGAAKYSTEDPSHHTAGGMNL